MRDLPTQRVAVAVVKIWYVLKVRRALGHQSALAQKWHFSLRVKAVLSSEFVHVGHELLSRDADEGILDLPRDVLGHCDNTLLAPVLLVGIAGIGTAACAERIVLELRLFGDAHTIVADRLSVSALSENSS